MYRRPLFSLVLLISLICIISPPVSASYYKTWTSAKVERRHHALIRDFKALKERFICVNQLRTLEKRVHKARRCTYAGLSLNAFRRVKSVCKKRDENAQAIRKTRKSCSKGCSKSMQKKIGMLQIRRAVIAKACRRIRWNGKRKGCGKMFRLKQKVKRMRRKCGGGNKRQMKKKMMDVKGEMDRLEMISVGKPSVAPRMW